MSVKRTVINTIASYTFFFLTISPFLFVFMYFGFIWASKSLNIYIEFSLMIISLYLISLILPIALNIAWELFKKEHQSRYLFLIGVMILSIPIFINVIGIVYFLISLLTILIANKWVIEYKPKTQLILSAIPISSMLLFTIGCYIWLLI